LSRPPRRRFRQPFGRVTGWLTRDPETLTEDDALQLKQTLAHDPTPQASHQQLRDFAEIMTTLHGERLPETG